MRASLLRMRVRNSADMHYSCIGCFWPQAWSIVQHQLKIVPLPLANVPSMRMLRTALQESTLMLTILLIFSSFLCGFIVSMYVADMELCVLLSSVVHLYGWWHISFALAFQSFHSLLTNALACFCQ